jgi:hypothetical protein
MLNVATLFNWIMPIIEWYIMSKLVVLKIGHSKNTSHDEIIWTICSKYKHYSKFNK